MKKYTVRYEGNLGEETWYCLAESLAVCINKFNSQIGSWMRLVIDWTEQETELKSHW